MTCLLASVFSRRKRSMALCRAVVVIQALGLWGRPSARQRSRATSSASCKASSASSKSLPVPIKVARIRPSSRENVSDTTCCILSISFLLLLEFHQWPNFNGATCGCGNLRGNLDCFIEVFAVEQVIAAELLFCLGERAIRRQRSAVAHS